MAEIKLDLDEKELEGWLKETIELDRKSEYRIVDPNALTPFPSNPSVASDRSMEALVTSITSQGFVEDPIIYDHKKTLYIIAGHKRISIAIALSFDKLRVKAYPFKSFKHAAIYMVASNRIGTLATIDYPKLKETLEYADDGVIDIGASGYSLDELADLDNYIPKDDPEEARTEKLSVSIKCESDAQVSELKKFLMIEDRKSNQIGYEEFFKVLACDHSHALKGGASRGKSQSL